MSREPAVFSESGIKTTFLFLEVQVGHCFLIFVGEKLGKTCEFLKTDYILNSYW